MYYIYTTHQLTTNGIALSNMLQSADHYSLFVQLKNLEKNSFVITLKCCIKHLNKLEIIIADVLMKGTRQRTRQQTLKECWQLAIPTDILRGINLAKCQTVLYLDQYNYIFTWDITKLFLAAVSTLQLTFPSYVLMHQGFLSVY